MNELSPLNITLVLLWVTSLFLLIAILMYRQGMLVPVGKEVETGSSLAPNRSGAILLIITVALVGFFIITISTPNLIGNGGSNGGASDLVYQIQIQDEKTGRPIKDAQILLEIEGRAEAKKITDSNGRSIMVVDPSLSGEQARLIVESDAYNISSQEVTLTEKGVPALILLEPND